MSIERIANEVADELMEMLPHGRGHKATRLALMRADSFGREMELGGMNRTCVVATISRVLRQHLVETVAIKP